MPDTRTDAVGKAILDELRARRALIDANGDLVSITVTVKLNLNMPNDPVRGVVYLDESVRSRRRLA